MKVCVTAIPDFDSGLNFHPLVFLVLAVEAEKHVRKPFSWPKAIFIVYTMMVWYTMVC